MVFDQQRYLPLALYASSVVIYTALVFRGEFPSEGAKILSRRNSRSLSEILTIHAMFLAFMLLCVRAGRLMFPTLPDWLTYTIATRGAPISTFEFLFILAAVCVSFLERRWLYVAAQGTPDSGPNSE